MNRFYTSKLERILSCYINDLLFFRRKDSFIQPISEPLVLISEIQRSGGTLLCQLFDGHPEVHCRPSEIAFGKPTKSQIYPLLENQKNRVESAWRYFLEEEIVDRVIANDYKKQPKKDYVRYPFFFSRIIQKRIFKNEINSLEQNKKTDRSLFNCYFTSYFNAWLDYQSLYGKKKIVVGFTPRVNMDQQSTSFLFNIYPDGKIISLCRHPSTWLSSARKHFKRQNVNQLIEQWIESAESSLRLKEEYPSQVILGSFESMTLNCEKFMRSLAGALQINFEPIMLTPTFNGMPMISNSQFDPVVGEIDIDKAVFDEDPLGSVWQGVDESKVNQALRVYKDWIRVCDL